MFNRLLTKLVDRTPRYTGDQLYAALCVWEHMIDQIYRPQDNAYAKYRHAHGIAELRDAAITIGIFCDDVYRRIPADVRDGYCFDWEVVPLIFESLTWPDRGFALPDTKTTVATVTAELRQQEAAAIERSEKARRRKTKTQPDPSATSQVPAKPPYASDHQR